MKRTVIFAHYDKDNIIDNYVIEYLRQLKKVSSEIIFVSDCELSSQELKKISLITSKNIVGRHGEYDFGSWKRGLNHVGDADQLVLCNDSCYLIDNISPIFKQKTDFFGLVTNTNDYPPHLQSFFLVFNKKVFTNSKFKQFFDNVAKLESKQKIIETYEVKLTEYLMKAGYSYSSLINKVYKNNPTLSEEYFTELRPLFPLLKTDLLKSNPSKIFDLNKKWKKGLDKKTITTIENHITRMIGDERKHWNYSYLNHILTRKSKTIFGKILELFVSVRRKEEKIIVRVLKLLTIKFKN